MEGSTSTIRKTYRSKFEVEIDKQLRKTGVDYAYEPRKIPYTLHLNYIPDFVVDIGNHSLYIEVKGYLRAGDKRKLLAVRAQHSIDLRLVFHKNYKPKDIVWAKKNDFIYSIGSVPKEWLETIN